MSRGPRSVDARRDWGRDEEGCSILHVDMDAFYASIELARRPHLRGRPVIVGGSERSVVLAATYEARAFGVNSAMPMTTAQRLCPQAIVVPPDHTTYHHVSQDVMTVLHDVTSLVEQVSIDEAFLDVAGARRRLGPPTRIAAMIRARVQAAHGITCSVGIAANKFVAKLASGHAKPDGVLLVPRVATVDFLRVLPVGALWGVGERTASALERYGIRTVAELADSDVRTIQQAVGKTNGAHLYDLAWGRDPRPVSPARDEKSVGAEETFSTDIHDLDLVESKVLDLADRCAGRLRAQHLMARTVAIKLRTSDFRTLSRSRTLDQPTDVGREIYLVARDLVAGVDLGGLPVRLVGVRTEGLVEAEEVVQQPTLEESVTGRSAARREAERAVDLVRERFGRTSIGAGTRVVGRTSYGGAVANHDISARSRDGSGPDAPEPQERPAGDSPAGWGSGADSRERVGATADGPRGGTVRGTRGMPGKQPTPGPQRAQGAREGAVRGGRPELASRDGQPVSAAEQPGLAPEIRAADLPHRPRLATGRAPRRDEA